MKAVMLSVRPKWCELQANGKKTVEVRKNKPKLETPFKCYIYCTLPKYPHEDYIIRYNGESCFYGGGKVIGEFVCDYIYQYSTGNIDGADISNEDMVRKSCLTYEELFKYENSSRVKENCMDVMGLYGWHISDLKIYDEPRELCEFTLLRNTKFGAEPVALKRPPQSWCYVEEQGGQNKWMILRNP